MFNIKTLLLSPYLWEKFSIFLCGPTFLPESWFEQTLICTTCIFTRVPVFLSVFHFKDFFYIFLWQISTTTTTLHVTVAQRYPQDHDLVKLRYTLFEDALQKLQLFLLIGFWEEDFIGFFPSTLFLCKNSTPVVVPPRPRGSWFELSLIYNTWGC